MVNKNQLEIIPKLNRLNATESRIWDRCYLYFIRTGEWPMGMCDNKHLDMYDEIPFRNHGDVVSKIISKFNIGDQVLVPDWEDTEFYKGWYIVEFCSNNTEAVIKNFENGTTSIVMISDLILKAQ